ncbi:coiled-coil domain-containing protein 97 [Anopheles marshallii]|uniref:coiled-coil domain-containing protein 97 n=1 Tax=Anopheles marshallii TaxID=1521116 RepID=UPI00237BD0E2|nr:coiled-coil domain-containing protein 97 [Anopheles marshallii]
MATDLNVAQDTNCPVVASSTLVNESDIFEHITNDPRVFYKNQQMDDPELTVCEKKAILRGVLNESHGTFLYRFGFVMRDEHLSYFEHPDQTLAYSPDEKHEIAYHLARIRQLRNGGRAIEVRNRRYVALQQMSNDGTYFTETEMMQRAPLLYEQLVGQFMTEQEKQERDARMPMPQTVVGVLLKQIDKERAEKTLQEQKTEEREQQQQQQQYQSEVDDSREQLDQSRPNSPICLSSQWGNFDEEEQLRVAELRQARYTRALHKSNPAHLITAGERELLLDEFIGIMHARFIAGEEEDFDYTQVDNSDEYDDLVKMNQDAEEKYFDKEDETESNDEEQDGLKMSVEQTEESEDELDIYMRHLNQHLEQQQKTPNVPVSVRDPNCEYDSDE